jgi:tetratricopeptide (TPR) repeat protein
MPKIRVEGIVNKDGRAWVLHRLRGLYSYQGKHDEAEKMYRRALPGKEKARGAAHTSTVPTVNNLGNLHADLGRLDEVEKMYQQALQRYETALGQEPVKTYIPALNAYQNLANLYKQTGRASEAEDMYSALYGVEAVFERSSEQYQGIAAALEALRSKDGHCLLGEL